jgi:hypothetical protein
MDPFVNLEAIKADDNWKRINIEAIWADELFQILDSDTQLQQVLAGCVNHYAEDQCQPYKPWRYSLRGEAPFFMTRSDGAVNYIDCLVDELCEHDFPEAHLYRSIEGALYNETANWSKAVEKALRQKLDEIEREYFLNPRETPKFFIPMHSCHHIAPFAMCLATAWDKGGWQILQGEYHSTVVDVSRKLIFDFLIEDASHEAEPVWFALDDPRSSSRALQRGCEELNARRIEKLAQVEG